MSLHKVTDSFENFLNLIFNWNHSFVVQAKQPCQKWSPGSLIIVWIIHRSLLVAWNIVWFRWGVYRKIPNCFSHILLLLLLYFTWVDIANAAQKVVDSLCQPVTVLLGYLAGRAVCTSVLPVETFQFFLFWPNRQLWNSGDVGKE